MWLVLVYRSRSIVNAGGIIANLANQLTYAFAETSTQCYRIVLILAIFCFKHFLCTFCIIETMNELPVRQLVPLYRPVFLTAALVSMLSCIVFIAGNYYPRTSDLLALSNSTPWGTVTSIFVHSGFMHLVSNLAALWVWIIIIVMPDSLMDAQGIRRRMRTFPAITLGSAIAINVAWIILVPVSVSRGASGLDFAFVGAALGYILSNIMTYSFRSGNAAFSAERKRHAIYSNAVLLGILAFVIIFFENDFLSAGPGVNVFVHGIAFVLAMFLAIVLEYYSAYKHVVAPANRRNS